MRPIDENTLNALTGSRAGDGITVWAWYDGQLAHEEPLPVSSWSMDWDTTRQIQTLSLEVSDKDGRLSPWLLDDPIGAGGTRLQVLYQVGGAGTVNLGWYRITEVEPDEAWRTYVIDKAGQLNPGSVIPPGKALAYVPGGATIRIQADDLSRFIKDSRLLAPGSPVGGSPTIVGELGRLLDGIVPVVTADGVADQAVSTKLVYDDDRLDAAQDLCKRITCDYRMNGDGQFEVYAVTSQTPVWTIRGGPEGALVSVNRTQSLTSLSNIFIARGTAFSKGQQVPSQGLAQITTGPLRVDGPHGRKPVFYESSMLTTQAQCDAYAISMRDTMLAGLTTELQVQCLPNPALQQGDWVTVAAPVIGNNVINLSGRVTKMTLRSAGTTVGPMDLTVECAYQDVQTAIGGIDRG